MMTMDKYSLGEDEQERYNTTNSNSNISDL